MSNTTTLADHHFVLIHGFGNTNLEMARIKCWLEDRAISATSLTLPFHESPEQFAHFEIEDFRRRFRELILTELMARDADKVVVISTSLSSLALLDMKRDLPEVKQVVLAPYLGASPFRARLLELFSRFYPGFWFKRRRDVEISPGQPDFSLTDSLSVKAAMQVENLARHVRVRESGFAPSTLVIHSHSDRVASFERSKAFFEKDRAESDFLTLFGAPHSFANTLNPRDFYELLNEHFFETESILDELTDDIKSQFVELNIEHRNWADKIFNLIVGFVTGLGLLTYQSLGDILKNNASAPYLLLAYATIIYVYVIISSLYFYYMNRTQNYLCFYIEPAMTGIGFQQFKLSRNISGHESVKMTFNTTFSIVVMPFLIASICLGYVSFRYSDRIFSIGVENAVLQIWLLINVVLYSMAQFNAIRLAMSTTKTIYAPPIPFKRSVNKIERIAALILSSSYIDR